MIEHRAVNDIVFNLLTAAVIRDPSRDVLKVELGMDESSNDKFVAVRVEYQMSLSYWVCIGLKICRKLT